MCSWVCSIKLLFYHLICLFKNVRLAWIKFSVYSFYNIIVSACFHISLKSMYNKFFSRNSFSNLPCGILHIIRAIISTELFYFCSVTSLLNGFYFNRFLSVFHSFYLHSSSMLLIRLIRLNICTCINIQYIAVTIVFIICIIDVNHIVLSALSKNWMI